ncbi:unnamed protein product [Heligmosomoides polygyrus]|uniref:CIA30 domain-containing protein n=1 Tax=Heligmosomoides polygyrus TaxID=6339 RepID=A0A183GJJ0_HELPZ|nr:unnamed protein product [Heligmosomoides polygyrus]
MGDRFTRGPLTASSGSMPVGGSRGRMDDWLDGSAALVDHVEELSCHRAIGENSTGRFSSCDTAEEFDDPTVGFIRFQMALNDVPLEGVRLRPGRTEFEFENFVFTVDQVNQVG